VFCNIKRAVFLDENWTMDNVQKHNICTNVLSPQTFRSYVKQVRFEAFTAVIMKNVVFWDVALCRSSVNRRFGGIYCLHLQGRRICERGSSVSSLQPPAHAGSPLADSSTLKMEAIRSSETSVDAGSTQRHIPEDDILLM
jgi:hypothetical protein